MSPRIERSRCVLYATVLWLFLICGSFLQAKDYYLSSKGNDAASGHSPQTAWRSIPQLNVTRFQPGDRILFQAGHEFTGNLSLTAEDAGTTAAAVIISSYGSGRATILAGPGSGITVESAGNIVIENLIIRGGGRTNNVGYGVLCDNQLPEFQRLKNLRLENLDISGFGIFGVLITGTHGGYENVRVRACELHDNFRGGMEIAGKLPWDTKYYAHANVEVSYCRAYKNTGDPEYLKNHSGSGIVLYQVDGGLIEHCVAWQNGELCGSKTGGGVGLWTCASRKVIIQFCESYGNKTNGLDGGGFDIDGGSEDCILQYNYSHDNDGPGLMVYTYPYASYRDHNNIVRFNISENDSRKSRRYAGLWIRADGAKMSGVEVYNNTITIGPWTEQAAYVSGEGTEARIRNNIFISKGSAVPLKVESPHDKLRFENNVYWRSGEPFQIKWGEQVFASPSDWQAQTGQENYGQVGIGFSQNPLLTTHPAGMESARYVGLKALQAFYPRPDSFVLKSGLNVGTGYKPGENLRDFIGNQLPAIGQWPLGAFSQPRR